MSLGSSDMALSVVGTAFSLLFLNSLAQGLQGAEVFHHKKIEAEEGQNVTLPCIIKNSTDLHFVGVEWSKNVENNIKLAVYNPKFGLNLLWPNVTIEIENKSIGSFMHLSGVAKWDSGIYICEVTTFPRGTIRRETELEIKDAVRITCDSNGTVEVYSGENVTIDCTALPDAEYTWTKNKTLVSGDKSLELSRVTDAHTGVYTLTVNTGNKSLHRDFVITVLPATTSLKTDVMTVSPQYNVTESAESGNTSSPTSGPSTSMGTDVMDNHPTPSNVTNHAQSSATSSPAATHDDFRNSSDVKIEPTHGSNLSAFSNQTVASDISASTVFGSKPEPENESNPDATPTQRSEDEGTDGARTHLWLVLIMVLMLLSIAVSGFLYRRHRARRRMDLPPPFKPPPPPVKYTSAIQRETSTQLFPTGRCDSVTEMHPMFLSMNYSNCENNA